MLTVGRSARNLLGKKIASQQQGAKKSQSSCRSVHKHRKRAGNKLSTEVFADFNFLRQKDLDESDKQSFKFWVIKEVFSSSIGAVVVSEDKVGEQQLISK